MQVLKQLFNFYINSSIHVALAVVSLTWITLAEYGISQDWFLLFFVFFASVSGYNFVKYYSMAKFHRKSLANWLKAIQVFSFLSFMAMCYCAFKLKLNSLIFISGLGLLTFFYAMPFLPKNKFCDGSMTLRNIGGLKVYMIALVWTGVTVFLPLVNNGYAINADVLLTALQRFIFIIILMLSFEIRDLRYDSSTLATIPQKLGVKQTKLFGVLLMGLFCFLEYFKNELNPNYALVLVMVLIITVILLLFSKIEQGKYYSSFWVEGLPILWALLLLMAGWFRFL